MTPEQHTAPGPSTRVGQLEVPTYQGIPLVFDPAVPEGDAYLVGAQYAAKVVAINEAHFANGLLREHGPAHDRWVATFGQRTSRVLGDGRVVPARRGELDPAYLMARGI